MIDLNGKTGLVMGSLMRFPDHDTVIKWQTSPDHQQLIDGLPN